MTREELRATIDAVEEAYEFFLAFAAQGVRDDRESPSGGQLRDYLGKAADALKALGPGIETLVESGELEPADAGRRMADVVRRDCEAALAAVELVAGQAAVSSQMIDNLNATIHIRAVLTDLFVIDEVLVG